MPWMKFEPQECRRCGQTRDEFYSLPSKPDKHQGICRQCSNELNEEAKAARAAAKEEQPETEAVVVDDDAPTDAPKLAAVHSTGLSAGPVRRRQVQPKPVDPAEQAKRSRAKEGIGAK